MQSKVYMACPTSPVVKELNYKVTWSKPSFPMIQVELNRLQAVGSIHGSIQIATVLGVIFWIDRLIDPDWPIDPLIDSRALCSRERFPWSIEQSIPKLSVRNRMRLDRSADRSRSLLFAEPGSQSIRWSIEGPQSIRWSIGVSDFAAKLWFQHCFVPHSPTKVL